MFGWCWWALVWKHDCFYSWAICFFCLGLLPIVFDSSTHFASAFHSASLHVVSRPALPSQLKPPMGVHLFVLSIYSVGAPCQLFFYCHPWLLFRLAVSRGGCWLDEFWVWFTSLPRLIDALGSLPMKDAPILASCAGCLGFCFVGMGARRTCLPLQLDLVSMAHSIFFDWWEFRYEFSTLIDESLNCPFNLQCWRTLPLKLEFDNNFSGQVFVLKLYQFLYESLKKLKL